jgi:hypothetical protein
MPNAHWEVLPAVHIQMLLLTKHVSQAASKACCCVLRACSGVDWFFWPGLNWDDLK